MFLFRDFQEFLTDFLSSFSFSVESVFLTVMSRGVIDFSQAGGILAEYHRMLSVSKRPCRNYRKQAGAELCQAQGNLNLAVLVL